MERIGGMFHQQFAAPRWHGREHTARKVLAVLLTRFLAFVACILVPALAWGQAPAGRSSSIVFPVVAKTGSFETEVWVRNANAVSIDVDVLYYEANGLPSPGLKACSFLTIAPNANVSFKLGTQCPSLATGSHFGLLVLRDRAAQKTNTFAAFSRVQHVTTNQGFSIEGFPEHTFSGRAAGLIGLKRKAAATPPTQAQPGYQPNCFVGSLGEPVDYAINVLEGYDSSVQIGSTINGSLAPYQLVRYLDILGVAGARPRTGGRQGERPCSLQRNDGQSRVRGVLHAAGQPLLRSRLPDCQDRRSGEHNQTPCSLSRHK